MPDIVQVAYGQTAQNSKINSIGMREMKKKSIPGS
jgi:hypothetical protein